MQTIISFVSVPLGYLLGFIYALTDHYGATLIIFTVLVRGLLYPLYSMQMKSTANMADIQKKVKAIQKKYAGDKEQINIKTMELYKEEKFNPMGGCLPMLVQMPIIFGLFALLKNPMVYISNDYMIMATHESFLWILDLSQPDMWIMPILAGIATFISFSQTQKQQADTANQQMAPMMNVMKFAFPIMIVWMGRSFPAGLTLYWFVGTVVQIAINVRLNKIRKEIKSGKRSA